MFHFGDNSTTCSGIVGYAPANWIWERVERDSPSTLDTNFHYHHPQGHNFRALIRPPPRGILGPLKVRVWHYCCSCERLSQHSGLAMEALCTICSCPDPGATILSTSPHCLTFPEPLSRDNMFRYLILPSSVVYHF